MAGLAAAGGAQPPSAEPYRAFGNDPAWSLTITTQRITFESPGGGEVSVAAPPPQSDEGTRTYRTPRLTVDIIALSCTDRISNRRYADAVSVTVDGRTHEGCGGALYPADSVVETSWHFAEVGGENTGLTGDLIADDRYAIDFGADAFVGYGGCNRIGARYSRSADMLTIHPPVMSTGRACSGPVMRREQQLLRMFSQPMQISFPDAETLLLANELGTARLTRTRLDD